MSSIILVNQTLQRHKTSFWMLGTLHPSIKINVIMNSSYDMAKIIQGNLHFASVSLCFMQCIPDGAYISHRIT